MIAPTIPNPAAAASKEDISSGDSCSRETLIPDCTVLKKAPINLWGNASLGLEKRKDGTIVTNPVAIFAGSDPSGLAKATKLEPLARQRALQVAEQIREESKRLITGDVAASSLSEEQKTILKRLDEKELKFVVVSNENEYCDVPNGILGYPHVTYDRSTHSVLICPAAANSTPASLARALAHEMGHVVSPCSLSQPYFDADLSPSTLKQCDLSDEEVERTSKLRRDHVAVDPRAAFANSHLETTLASCGALSKRPGLTFTKPEIFAPAFQCLKGQYKTAREAQMKLLTKLEIDLTPSSSAKEIADRLEKRHPFHCQATAEEHFGDEFGAKLFDRYAERKKLSSEDVRASLIDYAGLICLQDLSGVSLNPEYPDPSERLNLFLESPYVQNALGCGEPKSAPKCNLMNFTHYPGANTEAKGSASDSKASRPSRKVQLSR